MGNCHWQGKESTPHDVLHALCDKAKFRNGEKVELPAFDKTLKWDEAWAKNQEPLYKDSFLKSAYREVGGEPWGTTAKTRLCGEQLSKVKVLPAIEVEDYIYIDESFTPLKVWGLPYQEKIAAEINQKMNGKTEKQLERIRADVVKRYLGDALFPNFKMPSDHVPIAAVIRYYPGRKNIYGEDNFKLDTMKNLRTRLRSQKVVGKEPPAPPVNINLSDAISNLMKTKGVEAELGGKRRRRMAQREFSSRRDSPVMVRLLQEIVAAHNKHNNK